MSAEKGSSNGAEVDDRSSIAEDRLLLRLSMVGRADCEGAILSRCDLCNGLMIQGACASSG
jgi:hypothetical protein